MFANLQPFKQMRPTDLPWLPQVPAHWRIRRAKSLMFAIDVRSHAGEEQLLTVSSSHGVVPRATASVSMFKAESYIGHKLCWPEDLVINSLWAWGRGLGVARDHGIVSTAYGVYRQRETRQLLPDYLHHLVRSGRFQWELQVRSQGVWKSRLQMTDARWLDAPLLIPPAEEQAAIVKYLAHADARIDKAIAAKRRLIGLLDEQKRSVIAHTMDAVSEGSRELRHVLRQLVDCEHKTAPFVEGTEWWILRTSAVKDGGIRWNGAYTTDENSYREWTSRAAPEPGDVIFTREAPVGEAAVIPEGRAVALGQRTVLMKIRRDVIDPQFLVYQIYGGLPRERISLATQGSTVGHFNMDDIGWMRIAVPSLDFQRALVETINEINAKANRVIARERREIELLQEFRARLVAEVVTGQVDVRDISALPAIDLKAPADDQLANVDDVRTDELQEMSEGSDQCD